MIVKLEQWLANNGLKLNTNKTVYMHFHQQYLQDPIQVLQTIP